jgi:small GTP-binding protein
MNNEDEETLKIVLVGESSVGKTSIITQFIEKTFQDKLQSTVGGTFNSKVIRCEDLNKSLKLDIWDTAGQERYRSVTKMFYKDADVALLVYDITSKKSFEELQNYWVNQVLDNSLRKTLLCIIANKSDLIDIEQVDEGEARNYAKTINALYFVVSAKDSNLINEMFKDIVKKYSRAESVSIVDVVDDENMFQIKKIRKDSVKITKAQALKKVKKSCC